MKKKSVYVLSRFDPEIARLYVEEGWPYVDIARHFHISNEDARRSLMRSRVKIRPQGMVILPKTREKIVEAYKVQKLAMDRISEIFGCSKSSVHRVLVRAGIKPRPTGRPAPISDRQKKRRQGRQATGTVILT